MITAACLLFMVACERPFAPVEADSVLSVLTMTGKQQNLAFELLSPADKALAWKKRFDRVLTYEGMAMRKNGDRRLALLEEAASVATNPDNYSPEMTDDEKSQIEKGLLNWKVEAEEVFSPEEIVEILFTLSADSTLESPANKVEYDRICLDCCCAIGSMMTCPKVSFSFRDAGLSFGACNSSWGCPPGNESTYGCGAFKLHSCDGAVCEFS